MREVLSYPLGSLPLSPAAPDGGLINTNKAKLLHLIEKGQHPEESASLTAAWAYDGMASQALKSALLPDTFSQLADAIFSMVTHTLRSPGLCADFVVDCYLEVSIKATERERKNSNLNSWFKFPYSYQRKE